MDRRPDEKGSMLWPCPDALAEIATRAAFPEAYELASPSRPKIPQLVAQLREWYPDIVVGMESCHLDEDFYYRQVKLADVNEERDVYCSIAESDGEVAAVFTFDKNPGAQLLSGRLGAVAPDHRNAGLAGGFFRIFEEFGRAMGAEMLLSGATLQHPYSQRLHETAGYTPVGIIPAYDRDMVAPGVVKRVHEALYAKVLAEPEVVQDLDAAQLTPSVRALAQVLFPQLNLSID